MRTILIALCLSVFTFGQKPGDFFQNEKTKILVVGTFHFDYPNLDAVQVAKDEEIDVLSPQTSKEVTELVEYIKKFKPTKIAIEAWPDWNANDKLEKYKAGAYRQERDERYQLAMRIAADLNINNLYSIDSNAVIDDIAQRFGEKDSTYFKNLSADYDFKGDDGFQKSYENLFNSSGVKKSLNQKSLLNSFKYMNSPEFHQYEYGFYLTGDFKLRETDGADMLALYWYSRNLRIFRNIQKITQDSGDRILVIVGNGHASVLRQLLTSSPEYDYVEFSSLK